MPKGIYKRIVGINCGIGINKNIFQKGHIAHNPFQKGHPDFVSKEARKKAGIKISLSQKGKKFSDETKLKMRLAKLLPLEEIEKRKNCLSRVCSICKIEKIRSEFQKDKYNLDGMRPRCKSCDKIKHHESYLRNKDKIIIRSKNYRKTEKGKIARIKERQTRLNKHPQKYLAGYLLSNAIRDGRLIRKPCEICGEEKAQGHHDDYFKPLEIRWLCKKHHHEFHHPL